MSAVEETPMLCNDLRSSLPKEPMRLWTAGCVASIVASSSPIRELITNCRGDCAEQSLHLRQSDL
jgi:hypothetical protein